MHLLMRVHLPQTQRGRLRYPSNKSNQTILWNRLERDMVRTCMYYKNLVLKHTIITNRTISNPSKKLRKVITHLACHMIFHLKLTLKMSLALLQQSTFHPKNLSLVRSDPLSNPWQTLWSSKSSWWGGTACTEGPDGGNTSFAMVRQVTNVLAFKGWVQLTNA